MEIDEKIKKKIIKNKIILEKDFPKASESHIGLAVFIADFLETNPEEKFSDFEQEQFFQEFKEIQDFFELEEIDKVKDNKEKDFESCPIRIPANFARFLREEIFPKIK